MLIACDGARNPATVRSQGCWHPGLPFKKSSKPPVKSVNTSSQMISLSSFLSASTAWHSPTQPIMEESVLQA